MSKKIIEGIVGAPSKVVDETIEISAEFIAKANEQPIVKTAKGYWKNLGPGLITGAAGDDPSGVATYSQAGSQFGYQLLWTAPFSFPMMATVQEMCARIGLVTGQGLAANIRRYFPRWALYTSTIMLFAANTFNIGANLGAMAEATRLLNPSINFYLLVILFAVVSIGCQIFISYERYARVLKHLALFLLAYIITAFIVDGIDWGQVALNTAIPSLTLTPEKIVLVCAILGTTLSPYLFYWQTSQEVEEGILSGQTTIKDRRGAASPAVIKKMRVDVWSGMFFSNLVMFFILLTCAATLNVAGITHISTAAEAARALEPLAGANASLFFALGIIGTGLISVPILAGAASYATAESFNWKEGLYRKLRSASAFYGVIIFSVLIGAGLNFIGINPIRALIYSALFNGIIAPIVLFFIVRIASNKKIMGDYSNNRFTTVFGWTIVTIMSLASATTLIILFTDLV